MPRLAARRPNHHHHAACQKPYRLITSFAVIATSVLDSNRLIGKYKGDVGKVQAPVIESRLTFGRIERNLYAIKRTPN